MRSLLRLDPDYALIGEVRDPESAAAAVSLAGSGRSLMGTLHIRDAVGVVSVLRQMGLADAEINATLGLMIAQRPVRRLCDRLGYRERTGAFEIWQSTPQDHALLLRHADDAVLRRALRERGETLMLADGLEKAADGITGLREIYRMGAILPG